MEKSKGEKFFSYKNKPLVRKGNVIYYGNMSESFVAMLTVESSHEVEDVLISDRIFLQLMATDPDISPQDVVVKHTVKNSLYEALDIAEIWIDRYTKKSGC